MAESIIKNIFETKVYENTGIANVIATKNGKLVSLSINIATPLSGTAQQWIELGTLIEELRPRITVNFSIQDNILITKSDGSPYAMRLEADGRLRLWVYTDKTTNIWPVGSVTYASRL